MNSLWKMFLIAFSICYFGNLSHLNVFLRVELKENKNVFCKWILQSVAQNTSFLGKLDTLFTFTICHLTYGYDCLYELKTMSIH